MEKRKKSLGRDVFRDTPARKTSKTVKNLIEGKPASDRAAPREVEVTVKLTPSNIKHLDAIRSELKKQGKGPFTRSEMIRVAITLLSSGDF